jgi:hypothetical protein
VSKVVGLSDHLDCFESTGLKKMVDIESLVAATQQMKEDMIAKIEK